MSDQFIGEIRMFGGGYAPQGWALCDGSILPVSGNEALFSLIGTTYGGDGQSNFALPDLRGRIPVHAGTNPATQTNYSLAQSGGTETVTLTADQLPVHTHVAAANSTGSEEKNPEGMFWGTSNIRPYSTGEVNGTMNSAAIAPAGQNQPHDNMMPTLTVNFIIALDGIYPSQS
ncbi:phage tail protein [Paenibacillus tarimensis]